MDPIYNRNKTILELNEDCELLIKKEIQKCLINYVNNVGKEVKKGSVDISEICSEPKVPETRQLYFHNPTPAWKERNPKMLPSTSATMPSYNKQLPKLVKKNCLEYGPRRGVDEPIQATEEKYSNIPRSTMLSRTRQQLCKRNSGVQSNEIKKRTVKTQTDNCAKYNVAVTVEPIDFLGMFEKGTNYPTGVGTLLGTSKDQATQMYEHITQSELFCIEWIHRNLFAVKLNPNTLVVDDKIKDISESACVT